MKGWMQISQQQGKRIATYNSVIIGLWLLIVDCGRQLHIVASYC